MQTFYTQLFSTQNDQPLIKSLLQIAKARLTDVLVVKSELAWEVWDEAAEARPA